MCTNRTFSPGGDILHVGLTSDLFSLIVRLLKPRRRRLPAGRFSHDGSAEGRKSPFHVDRKLASSLHDNTGAVVMGLDGACASGVPWLQDLLTCMKMSPSRSIYRRFLQLVYRILTPPGSWPAKLK